MDITTAYVTQSLDTQIEAELIQFKLWRRMSSGQKLNLVRRTYGKGCQLIFMGIYHQFPNCSKDELKQLYLVKRWGDFFVSIQNLLDFSGELMLEDPIWLIQQVATIFDSLQIPYYVSGSVASSLR